MNKQQAVLTKETLFKLVRDVKSQGKKICITHGAYDLFHYSHLDLLYKSAAICDYLIVGVDSDECVSKYKSYKRPIFSEKQRLKIINSIECVNAVFLKDIDFDTESHIRLYKDMMADIVTIGQNYAYEDVIAEEAEKACAKLIKVDTWQEPTTSSIINKILEEYSFEEFKRVPKAYY